MAGALLGVGLRWPQVRISEPADEQKAAACEDLDYTSLAPGDASGRPWQKTAPIDRSVVDNRSSALGSKIAERSSPSKRP